MIGTNTPPLNQWREVCRWDEPSIFDDLGTLEYGPQSEPMSDEELAVAKDEALKMVLGERDFELLRQMAELWPTSMELWEAFQNMAAAFEELAGEHRELWEAFMRDAEALSTPCPGDPEDYTFVRAYYRPRRSKLAAIEPDHPTVQADPAAGEIDTLQGQGEARNADGTPYIVGESGVGSAIPQSGEERSE